MSESKTKKVTVLRTFKDEDKLHRFGTVVEMQAEKVKPYVDKGLVAAGEVDFITKKKIETLKGRIERADAESAAIMQKQLDELTGANKKATAKKSS